MSDSNTETGARIVENSTPVEPQTPKGGIAETAHFIRRSIHNLFNSKESSRGQIDKNVLPTVAGLEQERLRQEVQAGFEEDKIRRDLERQGLMNNDQTIKDSDSKYSLDTPVQNSPTQGGSPLNNGVRYEPVNPIALKKELTEVK